MVGHEEPLHETIHGSMIAAQWTVEESDLAIYELQGRKFGSGDEGASVLCQFICAEQGRHAHIDYCRGLDDCRGTEREHIQERMKPDVHRAKDWITHRLKWARSGKALDSAFSLYHCSP
jgi:hypothetical protein